MGRRDEMRRQALDVEVISSQGGGATPDEVLGLANELGKALGYTPKVTYEARGYHIYVPCLMCIPTHGKAELVDPKMAINADKYLASTKAYKHLGQQLEPWQQSQQMANNKERDRSCCCMRQLGANTTVGDNVRHFTTVTDLLSGKTITERFPDVHTTHRKVTEIADAQKETHWVLHEPSGQMVPPPPGKTASLSEIHAINPGHPVLVFIQQRGFDWRKLEQQFGACYCEEEWPHGQNKIWHKDLKTDGWRDTPQGRLILYTFKDGVPVTWQARVLEWVTDCGCYKYYFHPYRKDWVLTHTRPSTSLAWIATGPYVNPLWKPSKYKTATHSYRDKATMGWDAAIQNNMTQDVSWCAIGEGPLDAARVGPGGTACLGKTLPGGLPQLVAENFEVVFTIFDNDKHGKRATENVNRQLMLAGGRIREVVPIPVGFGKKDTGDMTDAQWAETFQPYKNKYLV